MCRRIYLLMGLLAFVLCPSRAEEGFYKELTRDGQIFVFTRPTAYTRWVSTGEMENGVPRLFYGPHGETVVFDREESVAVYDRRRKGLASPPVPVKGLLAETKPMSSTPKPVVLASSPDPRESGAASTAAPVSAPAVMAAPVSLAPTAPPAALTKAEETKSFKAPVSWKNGRTVLETESAVIGLSTRIQHRFSHENPYKTTNVGVGPGVGRSSFRVRRGELRLDGWVYRKNLTFEQIIDWTSTSNIVQDLFLQWDAFSNKKFLVRMGQFKAPLGRQQLLPITHMQFVDRSTVTDVFTGGRDQGVQLGGLFWAEKIDWRVALFNGNGRQQAANDNGRLQQNIRLQFQPWGDPGINESDLESARKPLMALGVSYEKNNAHNTATATNDLKRHIGAVDLVFKFKGLSLTGEYFHRRLDFETTAPYSSDGYFGQVGCFLNKTRTVEGVARYAEWDPNHKTHRDLRTESGAGVNYYINRNFLKVQADYRRLQDKSRGAHDDEARAQIQWMF